MHHRHLAPMRDRVWALRYKKMCVCHSRPVGGGVGRMPLIEAEMEGMWMVSVVN
jgi:hypothetical protein